jgi:hypothetical protein
MSSTVRQYGFVAVLLKPLNEEEREETNENLWSEKSDLSVSYDGTLLYVDYNSNKPMREREDIHGLHLGSLAPEGLKEFVELAAASGFDLDLTTIQPYNCIYYNGGDSPLDMLTKEKLLSRDVSDL